MKKTTDRFSELDALRGFAALVVVMFHLTEHGLTHEAPLFEMKWGMHGVQLFFCISGFVIYWTLERSKTLLDFAVSRFSRLYPAYWAALAVLAVVLLVFRDEPLWITGYAVNATMLQTFLGFPDLDVVYWTLAVELVFYVWMAGFFALKLLDRIEWVAAGWLAVSAALCFVVLKDGKFPSLVHSLLIFEHLPFFIGGMMFYRIRQEGWSPMRVALIILAGATTTILAGLHGVWVALAVFGIFGLATAGWLRWIVNPATVWLGAISYTLYLVHRALGDYVMMDLIHVGVSKWLAFLVAIACALTLATAISKLIEQPAMRLVRDTYKRFTDRRALAAREPTAAALLGSQRRTRNVEPAR